jgi:Protein of unknown function (DUF3631)
VIDADSVDPMPEASGADLLDEVCNALQTYVVFADDHQAVAITLWIGATHALPAWDHATRLTITSPQKRCGKSRLMDVTAALSSSPLLAANATTPAIYRSIGDDSGAPTLFFDEADALFGTKRAAEQNEDLRALINAGWQRDRPVLRCVGGGHVPVEFNTFAMAGLAAIGRLPDTITDRAVNISLKRRGRLEHVSPFRLRRDGQRLNDLRERLAVWVRDDVRMKELAESEPAMPVEDRAADAWEPLMAVADAAGGDWPNRARAACSALVDAAETADEGQLTSIQLLSDIRRVFDDKSVQFMSSADLVTSLWAIADSPWGDFELSRNKLAFRLRDYGIKPTRDSTGSVRGYRLADLKDAFDRYLREETPDGEASSGKASDGAEPSDGSESPDGSGRQTSSSDGPECQIANESSVENLSSGETFDASTDADKNNYDYGRNESAEASAEVAEIAR